MISRFFSTPDFESAFTYEGTDLGAVWTKDRTDFRVWAPTAEAVVLRIYHSGTPGMDDLLDQREMKPDVQGTWVAHCNGNLNGLYYTYCVNVNGSWVEACDPYARSTGVNGKRAMIIDLESTNPAGWDADTDPNAGIAFTDAVIYELHVRDLSIDRSSGISNKVHKAYYVFTTGNCTKSSALNKVAGGYNTYIFIIF